ncbi:ATP-dependent DNA helicase RecG [Porphyromonadaceae bacterium W3.11]|nr:ATP-dependent DNA helicase RecG [Porphyromonadaceae bacterium W3.11]
MDILDRDITYLKGVGERRAKVLEKEADIKTWRDLLYYFPYKHIDRTKIYQVKELRPGMPYVQLQGKLLGFVEEGSRYKKRLKAYFEDQTGTIELVWFNSIQYILRSVKVGESYTIFGKPTLFNSIFTIAHPEMELVNASKKSVKGLYPMYNTSERMKKSSLSSKAISELMDNLLHEVKGYLPETLPSYIVQEYNMLSHAEALEMIHFPQDPIFLQRAIARLKMEEVFFFALRMRYLHSRRRLETKGYVYHNVGERFNSFYSHGLSFDLTNAQKRVVKEIHADMQSGFQMNRLLQGDVGSGKTIVAVLSMLLALDNGFQACLMAPTEILAQQHYQSLSGMLNDHHVKVALLTGSMKARERKPILEELKNGMIDILVGTHILIQDYVQFHNLGLAVIDEQHRFGVYQRSVLWEKSRGLNPHILIMSATPIPRTLAMTLYGDLDVSIIDELPPGRTPIVTSHAREKDRMSVNQFVHQQLLLGRQVYVVFPLIEESEKLDLQSLEEGFQDLVAAFPGHNVGMVHGKMNSEDKEEEMRKFVSGETHILVATTVIEVGVNVPNATVMIINSAERFGLSQLHQLRGRVGRGSDQSYCILMSPNNISATSERRINIMCDSTDGFYIAEEDLKLRGHGDLEGTAQSGTGISMKIADLAQDSRMVHFCSNLVEHILTEDPNLMDPKNFLLRQRLQQDLEDEKDWGLIS